MAAIPQAIGPNPAAGASEEWDKTEASPLRTAYPVCERLAIPARGLIWASVLSGILWTLILVGAREAWRLLAPGVGH